MNILVLGASGMAGHVISIYLREHGFQVDTLAATNKFDGNTILIDIMNTSEIEEIFKVKDYDYIINCIGLLVKQSAEAKDRSTYTNSYFPHFLENYFIDKKTKIIHLSTDGVFSSRNSAYDEKSSYDTESFYGLTKAVGEVINDKDLTFRMSIIGPSMKRSDPSLFNWFYQQHENISGFTNIQWNGITTIELAKAIKAAIDQDIVGVYHLTSNESISKFDLLVLFKNIFNRKDVTISPALGSGSGTTLINTRNDLSYEAPQYESMIVEMRDWIENHKQYYSHY